jgi:hypothetical protein
VSESETGRRVRALVTAFFSLFLTTPLPLCGSEVTKRHCELGNGKEAEEGM